jgi:hypothetical protein
VVDNGVNEIIQKTLEAIRNPDDSKCSGVSSAMSTAISIARDDSARTAKINIATAVNAIKDCDGNALAKYLRDLTSAIMSTEPNEYAVVNGYMPAAVNIPTAWTFSEGNATWSHRVLPAENENTSTPVEDEDFLDFVSATREEWIARVGKMGTVTSDDVD